ncbi:hypothetical protein IHE61_30975 [Streptomyces sp. GKU 257-1]|nr:hypothetical protein [Streptomyces sp. GKU 257-1]
MTAPSDVPEQAIDPLRSETRGDGPQARIVPRGHGGGWAIIVREHSGQPMRERPRELLPTSAVPSRQMRSNALAALGFAVCSGWSWAEVPPGAHLPGRLIASARVRHRTPRLTSL